MSQFLQGSDQAFFFPKVEVSGAKHVVDLKPDFEALGKIPGRGIIVTGIAPPDSGFDFYSRFFAPDCGINEVTLLP